MFSVFIMGFSDTVIVRTWLENILDIALGVKNLRWPQFANLHVSPFSGAPTMVLTMHTHEECPRAQL